MAKTIRKISLNTYTELAEQPITPVELHTALQKGGRNKALGSDGIGLEFYTTNWKIIREDSRDTEPNVPTAKHLPAAEAWNYNLYLRSTQCRLQKDADQSRFSTQTINC